MSVCSQLFQQKASIMRIPTLTVVWLDTNSIDSAGSFLTKLKDHQSVRTFTSVDQCIAYINSHSDEVIFPIVSGFFATQIVPEIYEYSNVPMIFIFCASIITYTNWAVEFCDKLMMFDHELDLLQRLWLYIEQYLRTEAKQLIEQADEYKERARQLTQSCG